MIFTGHHDAPLHSAFIVQPRLVSGAEVLGAKGGEGEEVGGTDRLQVGDLHRVGRIALEPLRGLSPRAQDCQREADLAILDEPPCKLFTCYASLVSLRCQLDLHYRYVL